MASVLVTGVIDRGLSPSLVKSKTIKLVFGASHLEWSGETCLLLHYCFCELVSMLLKITEGMNVPANYNT